MLLTGCHWRVSLFFSAPKLLLLDLSMQALCPRSAPQKVFFFFFFFLFIYLTVLGLSCSMWDLVPHSGIKPRLPALGA